MSVNKIGYFFYPSNDRQKYMYGRSEKSNLVRLLYCRQKGPHGNDASYMCVLLKRPGFPGVFFANTKLAHFIQ